MTSPNQKLNTKLHRKKTTKTRTEEITFHLQKKTKKKQQQQQQQ
jgi:hypothetical protein